MNSLNTFFSKVIVLLRSLKIKWITIQLEINKMYNLYYIEIML